VAALTRPEPLDVIYNRSFLDVRNLHDATG